MPWVLHMTWQITLGSLHLIIHFNAHLNEELQEMGKYIIFSKYFKTSFFFFPPSLPFSDRLNVIIPIQHLDGKH